MSKTLKVIELTIMAMATAMVVPAFLVIEYKLLVSQLLVPGVSAFVLLGLILVRRFKLEKTLFLTQFPWVIAVQFLMGYLLEVNYCSWDVYTLVKSAREWTLGEPINTFYFSQYPGNIPTMLALSWVFKFTHWAFGSTSLQFLIALNIFCLDLAILAMVKLTARISDARTGYLAGLLSFLYVPFYLFVPICYTDIYCMPFLFWGALQAVDMIDCWRSERGIGRVAILKGLAFVSLLFLGTQIKSSGVILLLVSLVVIGLRVPVRRAVLCALLVLGSYSAMNKAFHVFVESRHVVTREEIDRHAFPRLHNIVMGLAGNGRYCREDVRYTQSFHSYDEKKKALVRKLGKRLLEMGPGGVLRQCFQKSVDTWGAGLCFAEWYLYDGADKPVRENVLHQWIALKGAYRERLVGIANGVRFLILLFVMVDMAFALCGRAENRRLLLHLTVGGIVTLLMVWETHPRYTIHYMPALIAIAAIGFERFTDCMLLCLKSADSLGRVKSWLHKILSRRSRQSGNIQTCSSHGENLS